MVTKLQVFYDGFDPELDEVLIAALKERGFEFVGGGFSFPDNERDLELRKEADTEKKDGPQGKPEGC